VTTDPRQRTEALFTQMNAERTDRDSDPGFALYGAWSQPGNAARQAGPAPSPVLTECSQRQVQYPVAGAPTVSTPALAFCGEHIGQILHPECTLMLEAALHAWQSGQTGVFVFHYKRRPAERGGTVRTWTAPPDDAAIFLPIDGGSSKWTFIGMEDRLEMNCATITRSGVTDQLCRLRCTASLTLLTTLVHTLNRQYLNVTLPALRREEE